MLSQEAQMIQLMEDTLANGVWVENARTGTRCLTSPPAVLIYDVANDTPLMNSKQSFPISACAEIIGYLRGYDNAEMFAKIGTNTWFVNANETEAWLNNPNRKGDGDLGRVYGVVGRDFGGIDLLHKIHSNLIQGIDDRGEILTFWKPDEFDKGCLRPCMYSHTFSILGDTLHMTSNQRSMDLGCGSNFNTIQCFYLLRLMAKITGHKVGTVTHVIPNPHIYECHIDAINEQVSRYRRRGQSVKANIKIPFGITCLADVIGDDCHARELVTVTNKDNYIHQGKLHFELIA